MSNGTRNRFYREQRAVNGTDSCKSRVLFAMGPGSPDSEELAGGVDPGRAADGPGPGQEWGDGLEQ